MQWFCGADTNRNDCACLLEIPMNQCLLLAPRLTVPVPDRESSLRHRHDMLPSAQWTMSETEAQIR